ncbi:Membrane-associated progesterone receptor component 2 [Tupaia chinensis]|uniref:Membrane-associated progesterone receptor component 2 n=1 Tax=Tupaia chinensis TaxID=246437 RepID=L9KIX1_TUPCH|nr:Membrane-associated progesterone receptor component 2 [Tupaia chinensis]
MKKRDFSLEQLRQYDGSRTPRILLAVNGKVFDVTKGSKFYGPGEEELEGRGGPPATQARPPSDGKARGHRGSLPSFLVTWTLAPWLRYLGLPASRTPPAAGASSFAPKVGVPWRPKDQIDLSIHLSAIHFNSQPFLVLYFSKSLKLSPVSLAPHLFRSFRFLEWVGMEGRDISKVRTKSFGPSD